MTMADIQDGNARQEIQVYFAFGIPELGAFAFDKHDWPAGVRGNDMFVELLNDFCRFTHLELSPFRFLDL